MKELIEKFIKNAELTTAKVDVVNSEQIVECITNKILNEESVIVSSFPAHIIEQLPQNINYIKTPENDELKSVNVCLTDSICGIAETGSVVVNNDIYAAYSTMLSQKHIVTLRKSDLLNKPHEVFKNKNLAQLSSYSVVTGPSATADMGSLVRGVHGPEYLNIIIIDEDE